MRVKWYALVLNHSIWLFDVSAPTVNWRIFHVSHDYLQSLDKILFDWTFEICQSITFEVIEKGKGHQITIRNDVDTVILFKTRILNTWKYV